jgi:hypothetical protein
MRRRGGGFGERIVVRRCVYCTAQKRIFLWWEGTFYPCTISGRERYCEPSGLAVPEQVEELFPRT